MHKTYIRTLWGTLGFTNILFFVKLLYLFIKRRKNQIFDIYLFLAKFDINLMLINWINSI